MQLTFLTVVAIIVPTFCQDFTEKYMQATLPHSFVPKLDNDEVGTAAVDVQQRGAGIDGHSINFSTHWVGFLYM